MPLEETESYATTVKVLACIAAAGFTFLAIGMNISNNHPTVGLLVTFGGIILIGLTLLLTTPYKEENPWHDMS